MSHALTDIIRRLILTNGPVTVSDYMDICLGHPEFGYYKKQDPFGDQGDFITAPEISQMFGELIGLWAVFVWQQMGQPKHFNLVELGPGRGTLMMDALRAAKKNQAFLAAMVLHFVETSPTLCQIQKQTMLPFTVRHLKNVGQIPDGPLIVIANEFFDALPIRQFQFLNGRRYERMIGLDDKQQFCFMLNPNPVDRGAGLGFDKSIDDNAIYEVSPAGQSVMNDLTKRIQSFGGTVLTIDYGYQGSALGGTFQAIYKHKFHDPLRLPGDADLTAHVDFSALAQVAGEHPLTVSKVTTQRDFLLQMGIQERAQMLATYADKKTKAALQLAMKRLIDDDQMGELFKVMAITSKNIKIVPGFDDQPLQSDGGSVKSKHD